MKAEIRDTIYDNIQLPAVIQAYKIPAQGTPDFYALEMLATVMSQGESSRLNKKCVDETESAMFVGNFPFPTEDPGVTLVFGIANAGVQTDVLEKEVNQEFDRLKTELISEVEFEKIRNMVENDFINNFTSIIGIAENLANYHMYFGDANLINTELEKYMSVTREDIMRVAKKYIVKDNRVVLYYLPKEEEKK
jgi:predicted Zn-dependent peptidase